MECDYYDILGISRDATSDEIKKAFRVRAMECHPDRNPDDPTAEERFKSLNEAYRILSDPQERSYYDRTGKSGGSTRNQGPFDFGFGGNPTEMFEEIFGQFFGGMRGDRAYARGEDVRLNIRVGFNDAAFGTEVKVKTPRKETCPDCGGSGAKPGHGATACPVCGGTGRMQMLEGFLNFSRPCKRCGGSGRIIREHCAGCGGSGLVMSEATLSVKIPAGMKDGVTLKLAGEGAKNRSGARGDLYVVINVDPHPRFTRRDDDLVVEIPITFPQAVLGAEIRVPTLEGEEQLRVPPGTQSGRVFRLRGLGVPRFGKNGRGDLHAVVHVDVPTKLTDEQKELLREFARATRDEVEPKHKGFFQKVKDILG